MVLIVSSQYINDSSQVKPNISSDESSLAEGRVNRESSRENLIQNQAGSSRFRVNLSRLSVPVNLVRFIVQLGQIKLIV